MEGFCQEGLGSGAEVPQALTQDGQLDPTFRLDENALTMFDLLFQGSGLMISDQQDHHSQLSHNYTAGARTKARSVHCGLEPFQMTRGRRAAPAMKYRKHLLPLTIP